jgi:aspartate racemase
VYPEGLAAYGLSYIRPNAAERAEVDRIIMDELVYGVFTLSRSLTFRVS